MKSAGSKYVDLPADFVFYWIKLLLYFFDGIANKKSPAFLPKTFKVLGEKAGGFYLKHLKFLAENVRSFLS